MRIKLRAGAIIFYKGKLLSVKMRKGKNIYHILPGGGVEEKETIEEALKREVKEETNLEVIKMKLAYIRELNSKEKGRGIEFYFYIEEYKGELKKGFDPEVKESHLEDLELLNLKDLKKITFFPQELVNLLEKDMFKGFNKVKHLGLINLP